MMFHDLRHEGESIIRVGVQRDGGDVTVGTQGR